MPGRYDDIFERLVLKKFFQNYYQAYDRAFVLALDAEWFERGGRNVVLSYQVASLARGMDEPENIIEYMPDGKRLRLAELIELGLRSLDPAGKLPPKYRKTPPPRKDAPSTGLKRCGKDLILLVSHNMVAEWSVLSDRDEDHITKRLNVIRKSPVTGFLPIKVHLSDHRLVEVRFFDTMLLAPVTHRSLKALSTMLDDGGEAPQKLEVSQHYKENMNLYLRDHPEKFEAYALRDSLITLKLFMHLQGSLNDLAYRLFEKPFLTLASAGVARFLAEESISRDFVKEIRVSSSETYLKLNRFIKRSYLGGRNESLFRGRTWDYEHTRRKAWVDIDFVGCYPSAMALVPRIDLEGKSIHLPLRYRIDRTAAARLRDLGITKAQIDGARRALRSKVDPEKAFDDYLSRLTEAVGGKSRHANRKASLIREAATVVDNRLLNRWRAAWQDAKSNANSPMERFIVPGFARVRFKFPAGTRYPCLPVKHWRYGLIYPLEGETVATAPELMLALEVGAELEALASLELATVRDSHANNLAGEVNIDPALYGTDGLKSYDTCGLDILPHRFFMEHLKKILTLRSEYAKKAEAKVPGAAVYERLLKEFSNSFYGKFAQSINEKRTYRVSTGEMTFLGPSQVTVPYIASLVTGLARAALSATLLAVEDFNGGRRGSERITVISCTTDGILVGLPLPEGTPEDYSVADDFYTMLPVKKKSRRKGAMDFYPGFGLPPNPPDPDNPDKLEKPSLEAILKRFGCESLLKKFEEYLPIRQMRNARRELVPKTPKYLEVKHLADQVLAVKTRGQVGFLRNGYATVLARFSLKPPITDIALSKYGEDPTLEDALAAREDYREIMDAGGAVRALEEAQWILAEYDKVNPAIRTPPIKTFKTNPNLVRDEIGTYNFYGLMPFRKILESGGKLDLTQTKGERRINVDFDWKRKLLLSPNSGVEASFAPETVPYAHLGEMHRFRSAMEAARKAKVVATPERVHHRVEVRERTIRLRGGESTTLIRMFLRGICQGHIANNRTPLTNAEYASCLNELCKKFGLKGKIWSEADLKSAKRDKWEANKLRLTLPHLELLEKLSGLFTAEAEEARRLLFHDSQAKEDRPSVIPSDGDLVLEVVRAVLFAPAMGLEPFRRLYMEGRLPSKSGLMKVFEGQLLTRAGLEHCEKHGFVAGRLEPNKRRRVQILFEKMGLGPDDAKASAIILSPRSTGGRKPAKNPARKRCLEQFVMALHAPDLNPAALVDEKRILKELSRYGLKRGAYRNRLNIGNPTPKSLRDSPGNVGQLRRMATALGIDATPFVNFLIDKRKTENLVIDKRKRRR